MASLSVSSLARGRSNQSVQSVMRRGLVLRLGAAAVALPLAVGLLLVAVDVGGRLPLRHVVVVLLAHPQPDDFPAGRRQVGLELGLSLAKPLELALVRNVLSEELELLAFQFCDLVAKSFLLETVERCCLVID